MAIDLTDLHLLKELEPVVEANLNRHLQMRKDWNPHDYIPWSDGKNYYALGGEDWDPEQSKLSEVAQGALLQNHPTAGADEKTSRASGGRDGDPEQSNLSEVARVSMLQTLLTGANLPSYHRE